MPTALKFDTSMANTEMVIFAVFGCERHITFLTPIIGNLVWLGNF